MPYTITRQFTGRGSIRAALAELAATAGFFAAFGGGAVLLCLAA